MNNRKPATLRRAVLALVLFGISFGYVEAAVVVYLREVSEPVRARAFNAPPDPSLAVLFPLLTPAQLRSAMNPPLLRTLKIELGREAATMVMLAAIALTIGSNGAESLAAFVIAFGIWDIAFYGFLKVFIHWPASLRTWDLLFLLPVPWSGPVLAPMIVSATMILAGFLVLQRARTDHPVHLNWFHWIAILSGALIIILSFTWDFRELLAGGTPRIFNWPLFGIGEALSLGAFLEAFRRKSRASTSTTLESIASPTSPQLSAIPTQGQGSVDLGEHLSKIRGF